MTLREPKSVQSCSPNWVSRIERMSRSDTAASYGRSCEEASAWMRLERLTIPTSLQSRRIGTHLMRCFSRRLALAERRILARRIDMGGHDLADAPAMRLGETFPPV